MHQQRRWNDHYWAVSHTHTVLSWVTTAYIALIIPGWPQSPSDFRWLQCFLSLNTFFGCVTTINSIDFKTKEKKNMIHKAKKHFSLNNMWDQPLFTIKNYVMQEKMLYIINEKKKLYIYIYIYICIHTYTQSLAKVFIPTHFFHVLCCCLMLNCFKLLFFHISLHSIHHNGKAKKLFYNLCKFITNKKLKWFHCVSIHTLIWDSWSLAQEHSYCL